MRTSRRLGLIFSVMLIFGVYAPVQAGGWATIELVEPLEDLVVGDVVVLNIVVLQHGRTPAHYDTLVVTATHVDSETVQVVTAKPSGEDGYYEAKVTFDQAGRWKLRADVPEFAFGSAFSTAYVRDTSAGANATPDHTQSSNNDVVEVNIVGGVFQPGLVKIESGATVRFTNSDTIKHEVAFRDGQIDDSGILDTNESFEVTFNEAGTFRFICGPHLGMSGAIEVASPA